MPAASPARPSATVLLVRDDPFEVLMVRRHAAATFADALVFPGGVVEPEDDGVHWAAVATGGAALSPAERALRIAAFRETWEEVGVLIGHPADAASALAHQMRDGPPFGAALDALGLRLDLDALVPFAHWITPEMASKRYDTHFFLARAPHEQAGCCDGQETVALEWIAPRTLLDRADVTEAHGKLMFPTRLNVARLAQSGSVDDALAQARARPRFTVLPRHERRAEGNVFVIPAEAGYDETESWEPLRR